MPALTYPRTAARGRAARGAILAAVASLSLVLAAGACGRRGVLGELRYFPGAKVVERSSRVGEAFGFPRSEWTLVELRVVASFERVRDFYAGAVIPGTTSAFESAVAKSAGRVYSRYLADSRRQEFYAITVEERQGSREVTVILRRGVAR